MPSARKGLLEIGQYIALDNPKRAMSFVDEIVDSLRKTLSIFPHSGKVVEDLQFDDDEVRIWPHGNYNSYYRILEEAHTVEVLFVFNANRDIQQLMKNK